MGQEDNEVKKYVWCTDIHLDFIDKPEAPGLIEQAFARPIAEQKPNGVFLTGDISLAPDIVRHLKLIHSVVRKPIYFVCGNHDFYMGSIERVRQQLVKLTQDVPDIHYLTQGTHVVLSDQTALVGHDGWYDAYHGDPLRSPYVMTDWFSIEEYVNHNGIRAAGMYGPRVNLPTVVGISRKLAADAAARVYANASAAAKDREVVVVLTHVPPFPDLHLHEGKGASPTSMPWYTSKLMGDSLLNLAKENPGTRFEVFCGHTHSHCDKQITDNLFCHVGNAEYGRPAVTGVISVP